MDATNDPMIENDDTDVKDVSNSATNVNQTNHSSLYQI